jgi:hypothetical protein
MFSRIAIAALGALLVTGGLLLSMDALTSLFENRSGERFFRITDVLPRPDPGRPERPGAGQRAPDTGIEEDRDPNATLPIEAPAGPDQRLPELTGPEIPEPEPSANR